MQVPVFAGEGYFGVGVARDVERVAGKLLAPLVFRLHYLRDADLLQALAGVGEEDDRHFLGLAGRSWRGFQHGGLFPLPERQADDCCDRADQKNAAR